MNKSQHDALREAAHIRHEILVSVTHPVMAILTGKSYETRINEHANLVNEAYDRVPVKK